MATATLASKSCLVRVSQKQEKFCFLSNFNKIPQLGLIDPDWCGLGHAPIHAPITVIREMKYDELFSLIDFIQSTWADSRTKERETLVWSSEGG